MYPDSLQELMDSFKYLPGIGDKTAERMAFAIMDMDDEKIEQFSSSLKKTKETIHRCPKCNSLTDKEIEEIDKKLKSNKALLNLIDQLSSIGKEEA